jgi:hypothetical protein
LLSRQTAPNHTTPYQSSQGEYVLPPGADELRVPLTWRGGDGVSVTKPSSLSAGNTTWRYATRS